jgi:three-Cys-motif partner protein
VDCFSYTGKYSGDIENIWLKGSSESVLGSPFIGIHALDKLVEQAKNYKNVSVTSNVILIEENKQNFDWLMENLKFEGFESRLKTTINFQGLHREEIAVINADSTKLRQELLKFTDQKYTWAFYFLDPYGGKGIPYQFVKSIIEAPKHDVMINFIYSDLAKKAGAAVAGEKVSEKQRKHVAHWTKAFNSSEWIKIKREIESVKELRDKLIEALGLTPEEAENDPIFQDLQNKGMLTDVQLTNLTERRLVDLYQITLENMDQKVLVKSIKLQFPDKKRPMFYLFLTTHNETGALELNKILWEAELWEHELRYIRRSIKKQLPPPQQMSWLTPEVPEVPKLQNDRPSKQECADNLLLKFRGKRLTVREIYKKMANEEFFQNEIDKALTWLKKEKKASYPGTKVYNTIIDFR